ncbi:MAG: hypothetical protein MJZ03_00100 [archaeon]|nr:hypothetical protein [archaeon]
MFIYVFSIEDRDKLLAKNYTLLKSDESNGIFIFENSNQLTFGETDIEKYVFSDTLTF